MTLSTTEYEKTVHPVGVVKGTVKRWSAFSASAIAVATGLIAHVQYFTNISGNFSNWQTAEVCISMTTGALGLLGAEVVKNYAKILRKTPELVAVSELERQDIKAIVKDVTRDMTRIEEADIRIGIGTAPSMGNTLMVSYANGQHVAIRNYDTNSFRLRDMANPVAVKELAMTLRRNWEDLEVSGKVLAIKAPMKGTKITIG